MVRSGSCIMCCNYLTKHYNGKKNISIIIKVKASAFERCKIASGQSSSADPEGGQGIQTPPPGKSQVIWVSIGNKQLDPPEKSWTPPPWKMLDPLLNIER